MNRRLVLPLVVFLAGALALAAAAIVTFSPARQTQSGTASVGGPFALTTQEGKTLTDKDLRGAPFLVFFGFTHCPDICPTKLFEISEVLRAAGGKGEKLKALFVTVDPERDTPEKLSTYLSSFDPRFIGLSGPRVEIDKAIKAWRVYARKVDGKNGDYTMDHTAAVYLLDPQGRFVGLIKFQEETAKALSLIRALLKT